MNLCSAGEAWARHVLYRGGHWYSRHRALAPTRSTSKMAFIRSRVPTWDSAAWKSFRWHEGIALGKMITRPACSSSLAYSALKSVRLFVTNV